MKWFVDSVFSYRPINAKAKELGQWVKSRRQTLLMDELSKDAFIEEAQLTVLFLNKKYPKTKPFVLACKTKGNFGDINLVFFVRDEVRMVALLNIKKALRQYHFRERIARKEVSND